MARDRGEREVAAEVRDGFGLAALLLVSRLIERLIATGRLSAEEAVDLTDDALLGLEERHATAASEAMNLCARETLERLIRGFRGERQQEPKTPSPPRA
jgi:polyhydroxyalkanoate synthesis regulator phasin